MHSVLVLGAGLVARPLVRYLLDQPNIEVTVASRTASKARDLIADSPQGTAVAFLASDPQHLRELVLDHDLIVSLLPYTHHVRVAEECIAQRKHLVTTSYVSDAMRALDEAARQADVILLNEIGLDPGIDHMSAMQIIHRVQKASGEISSFTSWCGGLPAPEANDNPLGYKFSWSPRGVIMAGRNPARYLKNGEEVFVPGEELFDAFSLVSIEGLGDFEGYPNRNSLPYIETYGIASVQDMLRGTLRNIGWCQTLKKLGELGLFSEENRDDLDTLTWKQLTAEQIGADAADGHLEHHLATFLGISGDSRVMSNLRWLGLLSDEPLPEGQNTLLDALTSRMLDLMAYQPGERDMIILQHEFLARYPDRHERITSTLIDFGIRHGDSAMSRTVSLPAAIGVRLILEGEISARGVQTPVIAEIYEPVLAELAEMGIRCLETSQQLD